MQELFKVWTDYLASAVEGAAAILIAIAAVEATVRALAIFFVRPVAPDEAKEGVRLRLARWLAVALEFELAADILRTAIAPSWTEIGKLAAIAALRTILNYFLQKEIEQNAKTAQTTQVRQDEPRPQGAQGAQGTAVSSAGAPVPAAPLGAPSSRQP